MKGVNDEMMKAAPKAYCNVQCMVTAFLEGPLHYLLIIIQDERVNEGMMKTSLDARNDLQCMATTLFEWASPLHFDNHTS